MDMKHGTHIFERSLDFVTSHYRPGSFDPRRAWASLGIADPRAALRRRLLQYSSAAASVAIVIGIMVWLFNPLHKNELMHITADSDMICTLPDSTRIALSSGSVLTYNPDTYIADRKVNLSGCATLTVTRDPEHPFSVDVDNATVTVLGTVFTVDQLGRDSVEVSVASGRVRLANPSGALVLTRGMSALSTDSLLTVITGELTVTLDIDNMPLSELADTLRSGYSLVMHNIPADRDPRISISFEGTPDELAAIINQILNTSISITAN